jgi:hypothetical protein
MVDLCTPIFDSGEAIQQRVLHDIRRVSLTGLNVFLYCGGFFRGSNGAAVNSFHCTNIFLHQPQFFYLIFTEYVVN